MISLSQLKNASMMQTPFKDRGMVVFKGSQLDAFLLIIQVYCYLEFMQTSLFSILEDISVTEQLFVAELLIGEYHLSAFQKLR